MAARISMTQFAPRMLAVAALAATLSACEGNTDAVRVGDLLYQQFTSFTADDAVPRDRVAAIPYATLGVRLGSSGEGMLVLASKSGSDLYWLGSTQFAITTRHGRIVRTSGFANNLIGFQGPMGAGDGADPGTRDYLYDLSTLDAYNVTVRCSERNLGAEHLVILGDGHDVRHVREDCHAPQLDWSFSNEFWQDPASGYVWKSVQFVHPDLDPLTLETLRPATE